MRVALVLYKIEAGRGSEDGSGYAFASECARAIDELVVFTRQNNCDLLRFDPTFSKAQIEGIDVPRWLSFWKKGARGARIYYYLWQVIVGARVRKCHRDEPFQVVHQYNFHNDWTPHFLPSRGTRLIWGPVAHQPIIPTQFALEHSLRHFVQERMERVGRLFFWYLDPALRAAVRRTDVIISANIDLAPPLAYALSRGSTVVVEEFGGASRSMLEAKANVKADPSRSFVVLFVGQSLIPLKGHVLALKAFLDFIRDKPPGSCQLRIVGGPIKDSILNRYLQDDPGSQDVLLIDQVSQAELAAHYAAACCFLYPSLGNQDTVVAEALAFGLPIVGFQGTGTAMMAGDAMLATRIFRWQRETVSGLGRSLEALYQSYIGNQQLIRTLSAAATKRAKRVSWSGTAEALMSYYEPGTANSRHSVVE